MRWLRPQKKIRKSEHARGMRVLEIEGVFSNAMLVMTTGPILVGFALHLGASNIVIGLLASIVPLAQVAQIPSIFLVEHTRQRKVLTLSSAFLSRLILFGVAALPWVVPGTWVIPLLVLTYVVHFSLVNVATCAWNSWVRDFLYVETLNAFFSRRLTWATLSAAGVGVAAGVGIDAFARVTGDAMPAYTIIFVLAGVFGMISTTLMTRVPEPAMPDAPEVEMRKVLREPFRDLRFRKLLIFLGAWNFAIFFAAPFYPVYLIYRLELSMTWVLGLTVLSQLFNVVFFRVWGRMSDRFSDKAVLSLTVPLFYVTLLIWPFATLPEKYVLTLPLVILIHALAGMATAGVALCSGNLALKLAPYGKAASYLAVNAMVSGVAGTVSPLLAGFVAEWFRSYELELALSWTHLPSATVGWEVPTFNLRGLDFLFLIAFVLGLISLWRLAAVEEHGAVKERVVQRQFFSEMGRMVREVGSVEGLRQLTYLPYSLLRQTGIARQDKWERQRAQAEMPPAPEPEGGDFHRPAGPM